MSQSPPFRIEFDDEIIEHFASIERKYHGLIREEVALRLSHEPEVKTKNRKPLREPILKARWELRCGPQNRFRVLYRVDHETAEVRILAIGVKKGNRLLIAGEEAQQ